MIQSQFVYVAREGEKVVGVLHGRMDRLGSLLIRKSHNSQGVDSLLVERFEEKIIEQDGKVVRVASSMYAVPFMKSWDIRNQPGSEITGALMVMVCRSSQ